MTDAVVLVGGKGTRLGKLTNEVPKPMISFHGEPFLEYLLIQIAVLPFERIFLIGGYLIDQIRERFDGRYINGVEVLVIEDLDCTGTLNALRFLPCSLSEKFYLFNGDTYFNFTDITSEVERFFVNTENCSIYAVFVDDSSRYGLLDVDKNLVVGFHEKSSGAQQGYINSGISVLHRGVVEKAIELGGKSLERDLYPALSKQKSLLLIKSAIKNVYDFGVPEAHENFPSFLSNTISGGFLLCDRDNTLNSDPGYVYDPDQSELCIENILAIKKLCSDRRLIVVSNQSGIERGYFSEKQSNIFYRYLKLKLLRQNLTSWGYYYCPHKPDKLSNPICQCRKPNIGLFNQVSRCWNVEKNKSIMAGDSGTDRMFAIRAGIDFCYFNCK